VRCQSIELRISFNFIGGRGTCRCMDGAPARRCSIAQYSSAYLRTIATSAQEVKGDEHCSMGHARNGQCKRYTQRDSTGSM